MAISTEECKKILTKERLETIFPASKSNDFFDALFGDATEGAYDIELGFRSIDAKQLTMELRLKQRPGCCLVCSLTQGLPQVFSRHPVINATDIVEKIDNLFGNKVNCSQWAFGATEQLSEALHIVPLFIKLEEHESNC